ncbi:hypothetical protein CEXT_476301 [Caerostris extrusa]|uniref:Uncharacterized protein n=1 Tax=Caerostris extrusa TaxID=172846 RepID=A0AAV4QMC5_CAEEX|nr:hypothetical protein CEXT_476301 [Caerostris extrusa]
MFFDGPFKWRKDKTSKKRIDGKHTCCNGILLSIISRGLHGNPQTRGRRIRESAPRSFLRSWLSRVSIRVRVVCSLLRSSYGKCPPIQAFYL